ncbi:MAG: hypothetical protein R3C58_12595 [Parvularculaceae bacterium]
MRKFYLGAAIAAAVCSSAHADESHAVTVAKDHAPIGVMGDHMHKKGEVMFSYRYMRMEMEGNRTGTDSISPDEIVTTIPNRFFGAPMQPATLRVVPLEMQMNMHMLGAMYAPADWVTVMAMGSYVSKEMESRAYMGGAGTTVLGDFSMKSSGFGDVKAAALFRAFDRKTGAASHHGHFNLGLSLPTGSTTETGEVLTPMGTTPTVRLAYPMQLGSGTYDLMPGVTYTGKGGAFSWGAQYIATVRMGTNDEGYSLGDRHSATSWAQFGPVPWVSFSGRVAYHHQGRTKGIDPAIMGPMQAANPDFHGGESIDIGAGVNFALQHGSLDGHRFAVEVVVPVYENFNGPQLEKNWTLTAGWQKSF